MLIENENVDEHGQQAEDSLGCTRNSPDDHSS